MSRFYQTLFFLLFYFVSFSATAEPNKMVTLSPMYAKDTRYLYINTLLKRVLEKTEEQYGEDVLVPYSEAVPRNRAMRLVQEGKIHVYGKVTQIDWEETLIPIRIPIRKGLLGYRLFMTNAENYDALDQVNTVEELQKLSTGAGSQWKITDILEKNGFDVVTSNTYPNLFKMLDVNRFATFSRGINEIYPEFALHSQTNPNIKINQSVALYSPLPSFFFVSPKQELLAERIQKGLEIMLETGEFDEFFYGFYKEAIDQSKMEQRKIFVLDNHLLSPKTREILSMSKYWYSHETWVKNSDY